MDGGQIVVVSMKRSMVLLGLFLVLLLVFAGGSWVYRDGLAREPGDGSFRLIMPLSAFPMPDGGFAIVDSDSERIVRFNAAGEIRWDIPPRTLFGRFLAVDAAPDGMLYGLDEITRPGAADSLVIERVQRLVHIGLDGSLAAVLLERPVAAGSGFVPGSLRMKNGELWYLYDDGSSTQLASLSIATLSERISIRSDWVLDRASLAPGGPGGIVAVAADGGLALFQRDRFETLSEYALRLPFPACIRYDEQGRLYVADPVAGLILRLVPGLDPEVILSLPAARDSTGPWLNRSVALDTFALSPEGLVLVDRQVSSVIVVDPDPRGADGTVRIVRELSSFSVMDQDVQRSWLAWMLLAGSLISGLLILSLLVYSLVVHAPRPLALLGASLPGLVGIAAILALVWYAGTLERQSMAEEAGLERLKTAAVAGAGALSALDLYGNGTSPETSSAIHPRGSAGWENLRQRLSSMVDQSQYSGWPPVSAVLYLESAGSYRYICDSDGLQIPGMEAALVPASFSLASSLRRPMVGKVDSGEPGWLSAVAPLSTSVDRPGLLLEMTSAASVPSPGWLERLLVRYVPKPDPGILLVAFALALSAFIGLPLLVARRHEAGELKEYRSRLSSIEDKRRAVAALKAGKADEARHILEKVVEGNPVDLQALNNLGAAYVRLGMLAEARSCFDAVVQTQPGNLAAKANLVRLKERLMKQPATSNENRW
jgi:hypothetical protein